MHTTISIYIYMYRYIYTCMYDVYIYIYIQCATMPSVHRRVYWLGLAPTYYDFSFLRWLFFCVSSRGTKGETSRPERHEYLKKIMDASIRIFDGRGKKGNARTIRFFLWFRPRQIPPTTRYDVCYNIKVRSSDLELKGASETLIGNRTFYDRFSTPAKWIPLLETIKRIRPFSVMRPNKSNIEDEITILVIIVKLILRVSQRLTPFARGLSSGWTIL